MPQNHITKIKKRDGTTADFDQSKITKAIFKAITAAGQGDGVRSKKLSDKVTQILNRRFKKGEIPDVEQIQDIVEETLVLENLVETARAYILYREQRRRIREAVTISEEAVDRMDQYLGKLDWEVQENANMAFSLQGLNHYGVSYIVKKYWLNKIYPKEVREANESGDFHVHNLDTLGPYCAGWDLYDLLLKGFCGVPGKVETKPAKHFRAILGQLVNFLYTLQGEVAGAVAVSNFDTLLAPFIRYDNLNYQQVKQAMQEFLFNMAVPTRVGFQCPFSNITLDLKPSPVFAKQPVIIGGKPQKETYGEFQEEMKIFDRALYETMLEGDKSGRPFHFPIPTINITKDFPWDDPAFDLIFEASAKYGTNYFANYINSEMSPEDVRSMCLDKEEEILFRNSRKIKRSSVKEVVEHYKAGDFDKEGWAECKKEGNLEVLSLNPKTLKTEWSPVKRFLKVTDTQSIEITTEDGKKAIFSIKHPIPIFTKRGIEMKFAKDVKKGDYLISLKNASANLSKEYQKIDSLILNEDLAKILGYFIADGNYLFKTPKEKGILRGLQFTFKTADKKNLVVIKSLIKKVFNQNCKEKQDPRYNTYYLYLYNSELAKKLYNAGFKKYGRLPQILFNSPASVIKSFLEFHFKGDGYEKRKEIHINDLELSRDLVLLYSLIGCPVTYKLRKKSQRIYLQHAKSKIKKDNGWINNPILAERVPGWLAISTTKVPGLVKSRMVGFDTLDKYNAHTDNSLKIQNSDIYLTRVKLVRKKISKTVREFYDLELEKNHLFLHSLGQISFNCCRLRLDLTDLYNRGGGGLFGAGSKTGSIGVVTINLPRIGFLSKTKKDFLERLGKMMDLAKESLEIKRKTIENFIEKGLYPYSRFYLSDIKKARGGYYANHFATIGLVGMNEAVLNFIGENVASKRGRNFTLEVLDFMRERLVKYQKETGNIYNLEATPAESTAYRLALKDKEMYPEIVASGTKKEPYYTNSSQLPVSYTTDPFEALKLQDDIQCKYSGGTVLHFFLGERISDIQTVKNLIKKVFSNFHLPYITLTPTFSICPTHGYIAGEHFTCPKCTIEQPCEVYSRIVGYLRPVRQWNEGKQVEFHQRKEFKVPKTLATTER
jgi:ribonucleoside-triphosphate reductase